MTRTVHACPAAVAAFIAAGSLGSAIGTEHRPVNGSIWVANRAAHTIRAFDAATGDVLQTVNMAPGSQPGDLAYAKGKIYVAEEFGTPPAIAIVDANTGIVLNRLLVAPGLRPHHVHASSGGNFVAVGLFGTDTVAVVDTHNDVLLGPWDSNPLTTNGRVHAGVFSNDGNTLYLANEGANELVAMDPLTGQVFWRMSVPGIHELAVTHDDKTAYVTRRAANRLAVIDLEARTFSDVLTLVLPDTVQLSANEKLLTVGLRTTPGQLAVVDTDTFAVQIVTLGAPGELTTLGGHQWMSPNGRYTFAAYEGGPNPGVAVIDHDAGHQVVQRLAYAGRPHGVDGAAR